MSSAHRCQAPVGFALVALLATAAVACAPPARGPEGGQVRFDAAMVAPVPTADGGIDSGLAPALSCRGVARSCLLRASELSCTEGDGCRWESDCEGVPYPCSLQSSRGACNDHLGCYWRSSGSGSCSGSPRSCRLFGERFSCSSQDGCRWSEGCAGTSTPCESFALELSCNQQPGCTWR
ncbi:MAG: hypothetical protein RLO52_41840 [Sandaracinaceae bacterium]